MTLGDNFAPEIEQVVQPVLNAFGDESGRRTHHRAT